MDRTVIADDDMSLARKSRLPGEGFFVLEEEHERERDREAERRLADASVAVVADPDADGLACVAVLRTMHEDVALLPAGPHDLGNSLARVAEHGADDLRLYVCDLAPDRYDHVAEPLERIVDRGMAVTWFDHHRWDDAVATAVESTVDRLVVGDSDAECTADVAVRSVEQDIPDHLVDLAAVTRDHDLWLKEDERSDDLADYAYWEEPEAYVETVGTHGADLPEEIHAFLAERRVEKEALVDLAVDRARIVEIGPWTVGVTYGRCSQNEVAEALREQGADASVIVKPAGSASIRGTDAFERCHEVAGQVNGGGHPKAAGCKPPIYDDMLDYAQHWVTEGAIAQRRILTAFERLVDD